MRVILTCGYPCSGYPLPQQILETAGLAAAKASRVEKLTPAELHQRILKAHGIEAAEERGVTQVERQLIPGRIWEELAVDLFIENIDSEAWGWAEPLAIHLLDFWRTFDPQIGFVFVYSPPEAVVGNMLRGRQAEKSEIARILADWQVFNTEMLRFYYRHRDRCLLVNAAAVDQAPVVFVDRVARSFGLSKVLGWSDEAPAPQRPDDAQLVQCLARELLQYQDDAKALYEELESSADLPLGQGQSIGIGAWNDYANFLAADSIAQAAATEKGAALSQENELLLSQLHHVQEELERIFLEKQRLDGDCQNCREENVALVARNALLEEETRRLIWQRDEQTQFAAERQAQIDHLAQSRDEQATLAAGLEARLANTTAELSALGSQFAQLTEQKRDQQQEAELLLLQLHQVQEELEHFFLENRQLKANAIISQPFEKLGRDNSQVDVRYDLRKEMDGENWYYPECDGRWAGPENRSVLRIPAMAPGKYHLQFCVVDAMKPQILDGMNVAINGMSLQVKIPDGNSYPKLLSADFVIDADDRATVWELVFEFPELISPADKGSDDERRLAIRLASLRVVLIDQTAPWKLAHKKPARWIFGKRHHKG